MNVRAQGRFRFESWLGAALLLLGGCGFDTRPLHAKARAARMCVNDMCMQPVTRTDAAMTAGARAPEPRPSPLPMRCLAEPTDQPSSCDEVCCGGADGCCPADCDAQSDPDCSRSCGDGVLQPPETCESNNRAAVCLSSCDDGNRCTTDVLIGSPDNCNVRCSNTAITAARDGDGCCLPGGTASSDVDCPAGPECGNGTVEAGEECDGGGNCAVNCRQRFQPSLAHRYSFDGTGDTVTDSIGGRHGRVIGATIDGEGLQLNGERGHAALPSGLISTLGNVTVEVFVTWRGGSSGQRLFEFSNPGGDPERNEGRAFWNLSPMNGMNQLEVQFNFTREFDPPNTQYLLGPALTPQVQQHIAVTFEGATRSARLYINGVLTGDPMQMPGTLSQINDENAWLGLSQFEGDTGMRGVIHEFRIYHNVLDASQVMQSFELGPDPQAMKP